MYSLEEIQLPSQRKDGVLVYPGIYRLVWHKWPGLGVSFLIFMGKVGGKRD